MTVEEGSNVTYRQADQLLVVSLHTSEDLLTVATEFIQFLFDDCCIQGFALFYQLLPLGNYLLNLVVVQCNFLLEGLGSINPM